MATADELARLEAPRFDFEMRFYVGGPYGLADITGISAGGTYSPNAATTLDGDHDEDDVTITVDDSSGFTTGTICIAPEAEGEYYEVIGYGDNTSDVFSYLTRPVSSLEDADRLRHSDGAAVTEWLEITEFVTDLPTLNIGERSNIVDWTASLRGVRFNSSLIANDRALLAMWRFRPSSGDFSSWTSWTVAFVGYLHSVKPSDTHLQEKEWTAQVGSIWMYISKTDSKATVYGKTNIASGSSVTASSTLEDPFAEYGTGEYVGWAESFAPSLVVDTNMDSLWISEGQPDQTREVPVQSGISVNEVYLRPATWFDDELQWIELHINASWADLHLHSYGIVNSDTTWKWAGWSPDERIPDTNLIRLARYPEDIVFPKDESSFVVLTNNKPLFLDRWRNIDESLVIDWRGLVDGTFSINPDKDFLAVHRTGYYRESIVWFRDSSLWPSWVPYYYTGEAADGTGWTGNPVETDPDTTLFLDHSIRRDPAGTGGTPDSASSFVVEGDPSPGYYYDGDDEWLDIDLGTMDIDLDADIDAVSTTELVLTSTLGLTKSGYLLVDAEIIGYASRDDENSKVLTLTRGAYSTTPAAHYKGVCAEIGQYEDGGTTYNHLVNLIQLKRKAVLNTAGTAYVVPKHFNIYVSPYTDPITPDDEDWGAGAGSGGWQDYWNIVAWVRGNAQTFFQKAFSARRVRHVLVRILEMSDEGRAKVNEVSVFAATGNLILTPDDDREDIWEGAWTADIIEHILETVFGIGEDRITLLTGGAPVFMLPITKGSAGSSIQEILKRTGSVLIFGLDNTITHANSLFYSVFDWPDIDVEWDRDNARNVAADIPFAHNVKQVIVHVADQFADAIYEARYPPVTGLLGEEVTQDLLIIGDQVYALLMAERLYQEKNGPIGVSLSPVGPGEFIRPGDRHTLTWDMDEDSTLFQGRNFVVTQVSYSIRFARVSEGTYTPPGWTTSIQLKELR